MSSLCHFKTPRRQVSRCNHFPHYTANNILLSIHLSSDLPAIQTMIHKQKASFVITRHSACLSFSLQQVTGLTCNDLARVTSTEHQWTCARLQICSCHTPHHHSCHTFPTTTAASQHPPPHCPHTYHLHPPLHPQRRDKIMFLVCVSRVHLNSSDVEQLTQVMKCL